MELQQIQLLSNETTFTQKAELWKSNYEKAFVINSEMKSKKP